MRRYDLRDEERLRLQRRILDWTRAGILTSDQAKSLETDLQTPFRRTSLMLRLGLAIFTFIGVAATAGLAVVLFEPRTDGAAATLALTGGVLALAAADWIVATFHFHRHGVEEALSVSAVIFLMVAAALLVGQRRGWSDTDPIVGALAAGAAVSAWCYVRFGFQYAAVVSMVCCATLVLPLADPGEHVKRLIAAMVFGAFFVVARILGARAGSEVLEDDAEVVAAGGLAGAYVSLNLQLAAVFGSVHATDLRWFWWLTYVSIWLIPALGIWRAVRERDRTLLRVALVLALATLVTNKPYLGWMRRTWDPMLFGGVLAIVAMIVHRWLDSGPDRQRGAFTAVRLLPSEDMAVQLAGLASAGVHLQPVPTPQDASQGFGGGRSGGGGATGAF